jgi:hypothetical protein
MSGEHTTTPASTTATLTFLEKTSETGKIAVYAPIGGPRCTSGGALGLELSTPFCGTAGTAGGGNVHDGGRCRVSGRCAVFRFWV